MKNFLIAAVVAITGISAFLGSVLLIEMMFWFHNGPTDVFANPALNAIRFAVAAVIGLGAGALSFPKVRRSRHPMHNKVRQIQP